MQCQNLAAYKVNICLVSNLLCTFFISMDTAPSSPCKTLKVCWSSSSSSPGITDIRFAVLASPPMRSGGGGGPVRSPTRWAWITEGGEVKDKSSVSSFPGCCGLLDAKATSSLLRLWWVGSGGT